MRLLRRWLAAAAFLAASHLAFAALPFGIPLIVNGTAPSSYIQWPGGIGVFTVTASAWNAATVSLEFIGPDGTTAVAAGSNTNCTANCAGVFYLPPCTIEAVVTGGTPTSLYASVSQVTH